MTHLLKLHVGSEESIFVCVDREDNRLLLYRTNESKEYQI